MGEGGNLPVFPSNDAITSVCMRFLCGNEQIPYDEPLIPRRRRDFLAVRRHQLSFFAVFIALLLWFTH